MEKALIFNQVTLSPVAHENQIWIRAAELARALGYSEESKVSRIYRAHADEFSDDMSVVLSLTTPEAQNGLPVKNRLFSPRGCHMVAMLSRTPIAKEFRKWVLDVLDKLAAERQPQPEPASLPPADSPLTPDQQCTLRAIVKSKVEALPEEQRTGRGLYPQIWSRFNNHFRLGSYKQLPQCRLSEAIEYLMQLDLTPQPKALPGSHAPAGLPDGVDGLDGLAFIPDEPALTPEQARLVPHSLPKFELELSQGINSLTLLCERMALFGAPSGFSTASHYRNRPLIDAIVENTRSARASCVAALHMLKSVRLICAGTR